MHAQANQTVSSNHAAGLALCRGLDSNASAKVALAGKSQRLAAGQHLFSEGDEADGVYEVVSGIVRLHKLLPDGRRQVIGFIGAGQLLGFSGDDDYAYTAEALTSVTLQRYGRASFERLLDEIPGLARRLLKAASAELLAAQDQMLLLGRKSATERIGSFLLAMAALQGASGRSREVQIPMSRSDIADYLGLTVETVSRTLAKLKHDGAIGLPVPNRVTVLDYDQIESLSDGSGAVSCH